MTQQERIWWEIKASSSPVRVCDLAERLGLERKIVRSALWHIKRRCVLVRTGKGLSTRYTIPEGETYKCIGRGNHVNSRMQLQQWHWEDGLKAIAEKRVAGHSGIKSIPTPKPKIELEKCWPSMIAGRK